MYKKHEKVLKVMRRLFESPDLSPIVSDDLDRRVESRSPTGSENLWQLLEEEWEKEVEDYFKKLINRRSRIREKMVQGKRGHFDEAKM